MALASPWADNPRLTELIGLARDAAASHDVVGSRGYVAALVRDGALLGSRWVEGSDLVGPGGPDGPAAQGDSPLGRALRLAVANYARGRVFVSLLWAAAGSAQLVIAPAPGPPAAEEPPGSYCSRCGAIADDAGAPCPTCGERCYLRLVPDLPIAA